MTCKSFIVYIKSSSGFGTRTTCGTTLFEADSDFAIKYDLYQNNFLAFTTLKSAINTVLQGRREKIRDQGEYRMRTA